MTMKKLKILYVDTDKIYAIQCVDNLIAQGYDVKYVTSINEAVIEHMANRADIIIFDIQLKDEGGWTYLVKKIKQFDTNHKSILLSNTLPTDIMQEAIKLKIDSCILKNKNFFELNTEIKSLFIPKVSKSRTYDLGNHFFYKNEPFILHQDEAIPLTLQEKKLIDQMLRQKDNFISNIQLQITLGKTEPISIESLRTLVRNIRRKTYKNLIINKNGHGYRINLGKKVNCTTSSIPNNESKTNDKTILIIKGCKKQTNELSLALEQFGIQSENAYTLHQANEVLGSNSFDYIVLDGDLPDGKGIELITSWKDRVDAKFIILANAMDEHCRQFLYCHGIVDYIIDDNNVEYLAYQIGSTVNKIETVIGGSKILVIEKSKKVYEQIQTMLLPRNCSIYYLGNLKNVYDSPILTISAIS